MTNGGYGGLEHYGNIQKPSMHPLMTLVVPIASLVAFAWSSVTFAQQQLSPRDLQATQQAVNNHANDCAQHNAVTCPLTATPASTATPRPIPPTPAPSATPAPTDAPDDTPTPAPCWLTDHDLGDPDDGYIVFWLFRDQDGNETYQPLACDQAWVLTPEPTDVSTPRPTIVPATPRPSAPPVAPQSAPPRPAPPASIPVPTATPVPSEPTATRTPRPTITLSPTTSPSPTSTASVAPTASPTSTEVPLAAASLPRLPFDWTGVLVVMGVLLAGGGATTFIVYKLRQRHLAQLAALDGID